MPSNFRSAGVVVLFALVTAFAWAADWPMPAGGPQRNAWARGEGSISPANVGQLQLLYTFRAQNAARGLNALTPPIVDGNLITYLGFKEMLMFAGSANKVFSVDADLNKLIWQSSLPVETSLPAETSHACPGGLTSSVVMAGSSSAAMHFTAAASRTRAAAGVRRWSPYFPPLAQSVYPLTPTTLTQLAAIYTVTSDGDLHVLNSSTGEDLIPPTKFLPPNANVTSLNIQENVVYATTSHNCDGYANAIYSLDLLSNPKKVTPFVLGQGSASGTVIGNDGTVYTQGSYQGHEALLQLAAKDLTVKDYFAPEEKAEDKNGRDEPGITPVVFSFKGRDLIVCAGRNGRMYLLDSKSPGGVEHHTPLYETEPIARADKKYAGFGFRGTFSSWRDDVTGTRWIYAPLLGPPHTGMKLGEGNGQPTEGSIVALKLAGTSEKPTLEPAWISENMVYPASPVTANRMVFVLSTGESARLAKPNGAPYTVAEAQQLSTNAKLIVLDAITGRELFSSGNTVSASTHAGGLAIANGRVYFTTRDNAVYCFGFPAGQLQLSEH